MTIGFYRNILNQEIKNFAKFSKKIVNKVNKMEIPGFEIGLIYNAKKEYCLKEIEKYDTVIFISHGSAKEIYHKYDFKEKKHQILLEESNIDLIKDKKVIAISCGTARELGPIACQIGACKVYLGFYNKIHFDKQNKSKASKKYYRFVGECYKDTFEYVIEQAIINEWTFEKTKEVLKIELRRNVTHRALTIKKTRPLYYKNNGLDQAILAVVDVANNTIVYGDSSEKVS